MATGLLALLDDIAVIARMAAASLDDVAQQVGRTAGKTAAVVIDDAAVTPGYVAGFRPERELPLIARIAIGSARNKLLILLPAALVLSGLLPGLVTPLLMLGGLYLAFEGTEKVAEALGLVRHGHGPEAHADHPPSPSTPAEVEAQEAAMVAGAIRTDFILSGEIMVIALNEVREQPLWVEAVVLALVGAAVTVAVYGFVAVLVKLDDVGVLLARRGGATAWVGRAMVTAMPRVLATLSVVGTAAMLWVAGGIVLHGVETWGLTGPQHAVHDLALAAAAVTPIPAVVSWVVEALAGAVVSLVLGSVIVGAKALVQRGRSAR